ncbi:hypothetical protein [Paenibacillus sp. OSY-SE]|uniref:hypothetical protein n=1 Tax=Paenibacillus sp. OSY-SE TaxID=1196323 RepID=UPI0003171FE9|nr:hypothetical protein [Paenibacillus sp. OSY-SE]
MYDSFVLVHKLDNKSYVECEQVGVAAKAVREQLLVLILWEAYTLLNGHVSLEWLEEVRAIIDVERSNKHMIFMMLDSIEEQKHHDLIKEAIGLTKDMRQREQKDSACIKECGRVYLKLQNAAARI